VGEVASSNLVVPTILLFLCFSSLQQNPFFYFVGAVREAPAQAAYWWTG
jgi:hypothetical protein